MPTPSGGVGQTVASTGRRALAETRRAVGVLRAPVEPLPGIGDLDGLVAGVGAAGLATDLAVTGPADSLPDGVQLAAYRVVQEALTNSLKHAGPGARSSIHLTTTASELHIDITDTGASTTLASPHSDATDSGCGARSASGGSGLVGMGERVGAYGGTLRSGPRPEGGWRVAASLRLEP